MKTPVKTYREKLAAIRPLLQQWHKPKTIGGSDEFVECPVCGGRLHMTKQVGTGLLRGICATAFCINFSEA